MSAPTRVEISDLGWWTLTERWPALFAQYEQERAEGMLPRQASGFRNYLRWRFVR